MLIVNLDTDALSFCKKDMTPMPPEEQKDLIAELNSLFPEKIKFAHDGYFQVFIVVKAKNYIMYDGKKIKIKGSAFKSVKTEKIMKAFMDEIIDCLVFDKMNDLLPIYKKYVKIAANTTDVMPWAKRATITKAILKCKGYTEEDIKDKTLRRNETDVWDAVKNTHFQEGDRVLLYPVILGSETHQEPIMRKNRKTGEMEHKGFKDVTTVKYGLKKVEEYNNDIDNEQLIKRVYDTLKIFKNVLDMTQFLNYNLVKNKTLLKDL